MRCICLGDRGHHHNAATVLSESRCVEENAAVLRRSVFDRLFKHQPGRPTGVPSGSGVVVLAARVGGTKPHGRRPRRNGRTRGR